VIVCSSTLPVRTIGNGVINNLGNCGLCDDAVLSIFYRTPFGSSSVSFQAGNIWYTINGGTSNAGPNVNSNQGTTYLLNNTITCTYGDTVTFFFTVQAGGPTTWGQGFNGSYTNLGSSGGGPGNIYTYTVTSSGNSNIYFNLTSLSPNGATWPSIG
jgi:hypothetical protein